MLPFFRFGRFKKLFGVFAQDETDGAGHLAPATGFCSKLLSTLCGQPIELRFAIVFADAPFGSEQAAVFETMQSGIERALLDLKRVLRGVLDDAGDGVSVRRPHDECAQDEHVERALQHLSRGGLGVLAIAASPPLVVSLLRHRGSSPRMSMGRNYTPLGCLWEGQ